MAVGCNLVYRRGSLDHANILLLNLILLSSWWGSHGSRLRRDRRRQQACQIVAVCCYCCLSLIKALLTAWLGELSITSTIVIGCQILSLLRVLTRIARLCWLCVLWTVCILGCSRICSGRWGVICNGEATLNTEANRGASYNSVRRTEGIATLTRTAHYISSIIVRHWETALRGECQSRCRCSTEIEAAFYSIVWSLACWLFICGSENALKGWCRSENWWLVKNAGCATSTLRFSRVRLLLLLLAWGCSSGSKLKMVPIQCGSSERRIRCSCRSACRILLLASLTSSSNKWTQGIQMFTYTVSLPQEGVVHAVTILKEWAWSLGGERIPLSWCTSHEVQTTRSVSRITSTRPSTSRGAYWLILLRYIDSSPNMAVSI